MDSRSWIEEVTGLAVCGEPELVQPLWSGFGRLERVTLVEGSVILKAIDPGEGEHPRGWNTGRSAARKLTSYGVERAFYSNFSGRLSRQAGAAARVARFLGMRETETGGEMILEDLDAAGFGGRRESARAADIRGCLRWLAAFHASFLGAPPTGLWERGTYWHLATRPDELAAIEGTALASAAAEIDERLGAAEHRTLVHGDAKLANFCLGEPGHGGGDTPAAAVDFQYVGGGVGVQDVAYFLGSCLADEELEAQADGYLDVYFRELRSLAAATAGLEEEWRALWPYAWADFHRFLAGWSPGHWKLSAYSQAMVRRVGAS